MMNTHPARTFVALILLAVVVVPAKAAEQPAVSEPILLWPGVAPGEKGDGGEEANKTPNDPVVRLTNVTKPTITVYRPAADKANGAAVLVCPGGGYNILAMNKEGTAICEWLNSVGVTAVLLKYRVPRREGLEKHAAPLQDAQRAMGIIRKRAEEFGIDPKRVGVIGFSAGGHLSAMLSTSFEKRTYETVDEADSQSSRPDFAMLMYPFYLTTDEKKQTPPAMTLAPEFRIGEKTSPTFIVMTQDDRVEFAYAYALALKEAKVPTELHIYPTGGHGFGLGKDKGAVAAWTKRAEEWMQGNGWLAKR